MRLIRGGHNKPEREREERKSCSHCGAVFAFSSSDTYYDDYDNVCVRCPDCRREIVIR